jgi:pimeloyl-ACP methyl ester carboxylesterase
MGKLLGRLRLWCVGLLVAAALTALTASDDAWAARNGPHVYLLRGIFNVSVGLDELATKLERMGIAASVYGHAEEDSVAAAATRDYKSGKVRSIILIGHSLGAGAVLQVARDLNEAKIPVTLLIALDPVSANSVPANVRRAINYYVSGIGVAVDRDPGFRGELKNIDVGSEPGMGHMAVQSAESMHKRMLNYVRASTGGAPAVKSNAPTAEKHAGAQASP